MIGGENGVGIVDTVENRLVGMKSRGVYETPGGTVLYAAHRELEMLCLDRDTFHFKEIMAQRFAELVYFGLWFTPLRKLFPLCRQHAENRDRRRPHEVVQGRLHARRGAVAIFPVQQRVVHLRKRQRIRPKGCGRLH